MKKRIERCLSGIKHRIGFNPTTTQAVLHLLDDALKRLEVHQADDVPAISASEAFGNQRR